MEGVVRKRCFWLMPFEVWVSQPVRFMFHAGPTKIPTTAGWKFWQMIIGDSWALVSPKFLLIVAGLLALQVAHQLLLLTFTEYLSLTIFKFVIHNRAVPRLMLRRVMLRQEIQHFMFKKMMARNVVRAIYQSRFSMLTRC